jgi:hypothetical protein
MADQARETMYAVMSAGYDPDRKCECASCTLTRTLAAEARAKRLTHRAAVNQTRLIQQAQLDHARRVVVILSDEHALGRAAESLQ